MALQGTLETFSVPEVLRLLSGTRKTGLLALEGDRGAGNVWLAEGQLVGARSDHEADGPVEAVLFDLLRYREGSFVFESDATYDGADPVELDIEEALEAAEELLTEWREIESVVPTLDIRVTMARALADDEVTITGAQWECLAAIGSGTTGRRLGTELGLGELDASRRLRDLVESGLIEVAEPSESLTAGLAGFVARSAEEDREASDAFAEEPVAVDLVSVDAVADPDLDLELDDTDTDVDDGPSYEDQYTEPEQPWAASDEDDDTLVSAELDAGDPDLEDDDPEPDTGLDAVADDGDPDEFLSQLANLSPRAAAAVEATASTAEAGGAHLPSGEADEEINRNLLLKFLSSTKN